MAKVRISRQAWNDLLDVKAYTLERFGLTQLEEYEALIEEAFPDYAPAGMYFPEVTELGEEDTTTVLGSLKWEGQTRLLAEFEYFTQTRGGSEGAPVTGIGVPQLVGQFAANG